jgi:hypothetical protein
MITSVIETEAAYNRTAYIEFDNDKVVFDTSDGEYGPIRFDIEVLIEALDNHMNKSIEEVLNKKS